MTEDRKSKPLAISSPTDVIDALDCMRTGLMIFGADGRLRYGNAHLRYLFPSICEVDDLTGIDFTDFCRLLIRNGEFAGSDVLNDPETWIFRWRNRRSQQNSQPHTVRLSSGHYIEVKDRLTPDGSILTLFNDVTSLMLARAQLEDAVEIAAQGVAFWNQSLRLVTANAAFSDIVTGSPSGLARGSEYGDVMNRATRLLQIGGDMPGSIAQLTSVQRHRELDLKHNDGRWFRLVEQRTRDGGRVTLLLDISQERRQVEALERRQRYLRNTFLALKHSEIRMEEQTREILRMNDELTSARSEADQAAALRDSFLRLVSHELRTPLNAIIGFSELMSAEIHGPLGANPYSDYATLIHESGLSLLQLINHMLDLSRIESGAFTLQPETFCPGEMLANVVEAQRANLRRKGMAVERTVAIDDLVVETDGKALRTALSAILYDLIQSGLPESKLTIGGARTDDTVNLVLELSKSATPTHGLGPTPWGESASDYSMRDLGLGLHIARTLVQLLGGRIVLDGNATGGTRATIILPKAVAEGQPEASDVVVSITGGQRARTGG